MAWKQFSAMLSLAETGVRLPANAEYFRDWAIIFAI